MLEHVRPYEYADYDPADTLDDVQPLSSGVPIRYTHHLYRRPGMSAVEILDETLALFEAARELVHSPITELEQLRADWHLAREEVRSDSNRVGRSQLVVHQLMRAGLTLRAIARYLPASGHEVTRVAAYNGQWSGQNRTEAVMWADEQLAEGASVDDVVAGSSLPKSVVEYLAAPRRPGDAGPKAMWREIALRKLRGEGNQAVVDYVREHFPVSCKGVKYSTVAAYGRPERRHQFIARFGFTDAELAA